MNVDLAMRPKYHKILCIEADNDQCALLSLYISKDEIDVVWATTLAGARRLIRLHEFALYLVNEEYPDGNGLDFIREVRAAGLRVPIIYQSAYTFPESIREGIDAGATFYLVKPFDMNQLAGIIYQTTSLKDQTRAAD